MIRRRSSMWAKCSMTDWSAERSAACWDLAARSSERAANTRNTGSKRRRSWRHRKKPPPQRRAACRRRRHQSTSRRLRRWRQRRRRQGSQTITHGRRMRSGTKARRSETLLQGLIPAFPRSSISGAAEGRTVKARSWKSSTSEC